MMQSQQIPMTFQRYETKYMLSPIMARKLRKSLPGHLQMDEYGLDTICSLYYDTPDHQLIRRSLEKPVYKEKLRLRSYGPVKETSPIYVELKKKYEGIVYKRRERMILSEAVPYLAGNQNRASTARFSTKSLGFATTTGGLLPLCTSPTTASPASARKTGTFVLPSTPISDGVPTICVLTVQRKEPGF